MTNVGSPRLTDELLQLKSYVNERIVHFALCDGMINSSFSEQVLTKVSLPTLESIINLCINIFNFYLALGNRPLLWIRSIRLHETQYGELKLHFMNL